MRPNQAHAIVAPAISKATARPASVAKGRCDMAVVRQRYAWEDDENDVMILDRHPSRPIPRTTTPGIRRSHSSRWRIPDEGGDQQAELVQFETDASGRVVRLVAPGYYLVRRL
jgi:hypothetical protein